MYNRTPLRYLCLALLAVVLLGGFTAARADTVQTYYLGTTNGFTVCNPYCGQVTISINAAGTSATFTVSSLLNGFQFDNFFFNGPGGLSLGTSGYTLSYNPTPPPPNADGFGPFNYLLGTSTNGGSTGASCSGSAADPDCNIIFILNGSALTLSTFYAGDGSNNFAGHMAAAGCSGYAGDGTNSSNPPGVTQCYSTPEPAGMSLLLSGLVGMGGLLRIRRSKR